MTGNNGEGDLRMEDLERLTGQPRRNIRYLISEGIVPAPSSRGRNASYGKEHVAALKLYTQLKAAGVQSLAAIRDRIAFAGDGGTISLEPVPGVEIRIEASVMRAMGAEALAETLAEAVRAAATTREPERRGK